MSMFGEELILKALAALSEIADECGERPARKSLSLRFLLAYTYAASRMEPGKKWIWSNFWHYATRPRKQLPHEQFEDDHVRGTGARSALNGICREVGYEPDVDFIRTLRAHRLVKRKPKPPPAPRHHDNDEPGEDDAA
jgi:hypothetical protein